MAERKSILLRVDAEVWKELSAWAEHELRSTNGQIEWILREAVRQRKGEKKPTAAADAKSKGENKAA